MKKAKRDLVWHFEDEQGVLCGWSRVNWVGWKGIKLAREQGLDHRACWDIIRIWDAILTDMGCHWRVLT